MFPSEGVSQYLILAVKSFLSLLTLPAEKEEQSLLENRPNMTMKQELEIILTS
jgi:hypothetical protein